MNYNNFKYDQKYPGYRTGRGEQHFDKKANEVLVQLKDVLGSKDFCELSYEEIDKSDGIAEKLGKQRDALKVTQLRKFFDQIKKIEADISDKGWTDSVSRDFFMLRPQLAYAVGRDLVSRDFFELMSFCLKGVNDSKDKVEAYRRFSSLVEATVAYRKYHEKRE